MSFSFSVVTKDAKFTWKLNFTDFDPTQRIFRATQPKPAQPEHFTPRWPLLNIVFKDEFLK